jgi:hypothetical protein
MDYQVADVCRYGTLTRLYSATPRQPVLRGRWGSGVVRCLVDAKMMASNGSRGGNGSVGVDYHVANDG